MDLLQQQGIKNPATGEYLANASCITIARRQFGTQTSPAIPNTTTAGGLMFETMRFQTLRWKHFSTLKHLGKVLLNLQKMEYSDVDLKLTIHRPVHKGCLGNMKLRNHEAILISNHYEGTLEQMLFRSNDARATLTANNATAYRVRRFKSSQS